MNISFTIFEKSWGKKGKIFLTTKNYFVPKREKNWSCVILLFKVLQATSVMRLIWRQIFLRSPRNWEDNFVVEACKLYWRYNGTPFRLLHSSTLWKTFFAFWLILWTVVVLRQNGNSTLFLVVGYVEMPSRQSTVKSLPRTVRFQECYGFGGNSLLVSFLDECFL